MGRKKSKTRKKKSRGLSGLDTTSQNTYMQTGKEGLFMLAAAIAASGAGAAIGKHSLAAGIPITFFGIHKKNPYIIAAGLGLTLSNGFQNPAKAQPATTEGMDGLKEIAEQAKDRVGTFFQNFKEKLYLAPAPVAATNGLGEDEQVTYFVNPYNGAGEIDMSAIDRVQEQIAEMTRSGSSLSEVDREF